MGFIQSLRFLLAHLNTWDTPCNWIYMRDILVIKSEPMGEVMVEKFPSAFTGLVVMIY